MTVYLIRHGKTQGNVERRYIGSTDQPLCPQGRAELAGKTAPAADRIIASPLLRCREPAEILLRRLLSCGGRGRKTKRGEADALLPFSHASPGILWVIPKKIGGNVYGIREICVETDPVHPH